MRLKTLYPNVVLQHENLKDFLSPDENTAMKLGLC